MAITKSTVASIQLQCRRDFGTISQQYHTQAHQRSYSICAVSLSSMPESTNKQKKGPAMPGAFFPSIPLKDTDRFWVGTVYINVFLKPFKRISFRLHGFRYKYLKIVSFFLSSTMKQL